MRLKGSRSTGAIEHCDSDYPNFLLKVGEGQEENSKGSVDLPDYLKVVHAVNDLINEVFEGVETKYQDEKWLLSRAILATTNRNIDELNRIIGDIILGVYHEFLSADSVRADRLEEESRLQAEYQPELLYSIEGNSSLTHDKLQLKKGLIVMLVGNIRVADGHANGSRYILYSTCPRC